MVLSKEEFTQLHNQGKSVDEIIQIGKSTQPRPITERIAEALPFHGKKIGEAIGTGIAKLRATPEERKFITPGPTPGEIVGDAALIALDIFSPGKIFKALRVGGRIIEKTGETLFKQAIPISKIEAGMVQTYRANNPILKRVINTLKGVSSQPRLAEQTAFEKGFASLTRSGIGVQAKRESVKLWATKIGPALSNSKQKINMAEYFEEAATSLKKIAKDPGREDALLKALKAIKSDFKTNIVDLKTLQKFKEGWAEFLPQKVYKGEEIAGAVNEVRNILSRQAREKIYKSLGQEIRNDYLDYGNLKRLQELGKSALTGEKLKGGAGSFVTDIIQRGVTPIATTAGQLTSKIGGGIRRIGELGRRPF